MPCGPTSMVTAPSAEGSRRARRGAVRPRGTSARRRSVRSPPRNSSTNGDAGSASSSAGVAYWARWPPDREHGDPVAELDGLVDVVGHEDDRGAEPVVEGRPARPGAERRTIGSTAEYGSSISSTGGSTASARATPTRCCWPPESSDGYRSSRSRSRSTSADELVDACRDAGLVPSQQPRHGGDVGGDRPVREQARPAGSRSRCRAAARGSGWARMSTPWSRISPLVGSSSRLSIRSVVVLPHPDGPTSTTSSPEGISRFRSSTAGRDGAVEGLRDVTELEREVGRDRRTLVPRCEAEEAKRT